MRSYIFSAAALLRTAKRLHDRIRFERAACRRRTCALPASVAVLDRCTKAMPQVRSPAPPLASFAWCRAIRHLYWRSRSISKSSPLRRPLRKSAPAPRCVTPRASSATVAEDRSHEPRPWRNSASAPHDGRRHQSALPASCDRERAASVRSWSRGWFLARETEKSFRVGIGYLPEWSGVFGQTVVPTDAPLSTYVDISVPLRTK